MKRILIIGCIVIAGFFVAGVGMADMFSWGVMGGVNFSTFNGSDKGNVSYRTGLSAGAFATIAPFKMIRFQPEAYISLKGAKYEYPSPTEDLKYNLYYLDFPLLVRWYPNILPLNMNVLGGPYFAFNISDKAKQGSIKNDANAESFDWGITLGLGLEIKRILIDGRYSFGLTDAIEGVTVKNGYFSILAGYRFGKDKED